MGFRAVIVSLSRILRIIVRGRIGEACQGVLQEALGRLVIRLHKVNRIFALREAKSLPARMVVRSMLNLLLPQLDSGLEVTVTDGRECLFAVGDEMNARRARHLRDRSEERR